jgi:hypothetical protein
MKEYSDLHAWENGFYNREFWELFICAVIGFLAPVGIIVFLVWIITEVVK